MVSHQPLLLSPLTVPLYETVLCSEFSLLCSYERFALARQVNATLVNDQPGRVSFSL